MFLSGQWKTGFVRRQAFASRKVVIFSITYHYLQTLMYTYVHHRYKSDRFDGADGGDSGEISGTGGFSGEVRMNAEVRNFS